MGKPPFIHYQGAVYHVTARGVRRSNIFVDDVDRRLFLKLLDGAKRRYGFSVLAQCLMSNHFHLLIQVGKVPLWRIMQWILSQYARYFNGRIGAKGYVFEEGYFRGLVRTDLYLARVIRYIHGNPVAAHMVDAPAEYRWSSARQLKDRSRGLVDLEALVALLGGDIPDDLDQPASDLPPDVYIAQEIAPCLHEEPEVPDLEAIARDVAAPSFVTVAELRGASRARELSRVRKKFITLAAAQGAPSAAIARFLGRAPSWISRALADK